MLAFILTAVQAFALSTAVDLVQKYPSEVLRNEVIAFTPAKDHHFSLEAPQNCGSGRLVDKTPRQIKCQFGEPGAVEATLNVCDDKKTFCKPVAVRLSVQKKDSGQSEVLLKNQELNHALKRTMVPGFQTGSVADLKKQAAAAGKPVFMMISTDWCPPCNETKEYLLPSETFAKASAGWFKVYVDGDNLAASAWEQVVPYKYYPSFVLLNSAFEEIARYTGPLRQTDFAAWAKESESLKGDTIGALKSRVFARRDGSLAQKVKDLATGQGNADFNREETRLMKWALDREDEALIAQLKNGGKFPELEARLIRFELAQKQDGSKDHKIELYTRLLNQLINKDGWAETWAEFCEFDSKACVPQQIHIEERLTALQKREGLSETERASMLGEEYALLSSVFETLGKKEREKEMALRCVQSYEKLQASKTLKLSRAGNQGVVACLESAGEFAKAEAVLKSLIETYPSEPTFLMRMARVQRTAKKPKPALDYITRAEAVAYGYNWLSTQVIKADIYMDLKQPAQAKGVIDGALKQMRIDGSQDARNQKAVARLRAAQAKAEAGLKTR